MSDYREFCFEDFLDFAKQDCPPGFVIDEISEMYPDASIEEKAALACNMWRDIQFMLTWDPPGLAH